jgi:hypothetical protein
MKMFAKLTGIFGHAADLARHYLSLADRGVMLDEKYAAIAHGIIGTAEKFIPAQEAAPVTILVPVPDPHAAALGAAPLVVK